MSPVFRRESEYTFKIYSNEEERMHIHVLCGGHEAKFWLEPQVELAKNTGIPEHKLNEIIRKKLLEITQAPFNLKEYPDVWEYIKRQNNSIHMSEFKPNEAAEEQVNILIQETLKKYHRH